MFNLDLTKVEAAGYETLPNGVYTVALEEAELKDTKDGNGQYLKCKFKVTVGDFKNRVLFHNFNIKNQNEQTVQIGLSQLKALLVASNSKNMTLNSPSDIIGLVVDAKVTTRNQIGFENQNEIKGFLKVKESNKINESDIPF
jgi:hypothetical protein